MADRRKARSQLDTQLQMAEAHWNRLMAVVIQSSVSRDTWGTSKSAESAQKALMARLGGPAPVRRPRSID